MKKNNKILIFSLLVLSIFTALGISSASAHGWFHGFADIDPAKITERQNQMFENQANLLGINIDQIKEYWAQGKNMREIAEELNISDEDLQKKIQDQRKAGLEQELKILVDNGVITQAQADLRLKAMENMTMNCGFGHDRCGFIGKRGFFPKNNQDNK